MNEELNKKLAEWAGWHEEIATMKGGIRYPVLLSPDESLIEGYEGYVPDHTPNFTESLDACFKWLVPKLDVNDRVIISWSPVKGCRDYTAEIIQWSQIGNHKHTRWTEHECPALALCRVIEKLVRNEG